MIYDLTDSSGRMSLEEGRIFDKIKKRKAKKDKNRPVVMPENNQLLIEKLKAKAQRGDLQGFTYKGLDFINYDKYLKYFSKLAKDQFILDDFDTEVIWHNDAEKDKAFANVRKKLVYGIGCGTPDDVKSIQDIVYKYLCGKVKELTYDDFIRFCSYDDDGWNSIDELATQFNSATQANPDDVTGQGYEYAHYKIKCCDSAYYGIERAFAKMIQVQNNMVRVMLAYRPQNEAAYIVDSIFDQVL